MPKLANGFLCFGPSFFVSAAFILSMYAQWRCNYVKIEDSGSILQDGVTTLIKGFGPTCYEAAGGGYFVSAFSNEYGSHI